MKRLPFFVLILLIVAYAGRAQNPAFSSGQTHYENAQVFRLKAGMLMSKREWRDVIYRFSEFREGRITLREGFSPTRSLLMNFNIYKERMEFITEKGDTSAFEFSRQLKSIGIDNHVFYYEPPSGYVEKITETPVALGEKHLLKMMFESTNGELFAGTDWHLPTARLDRLYIKKNEYYFIDQEDVLHKATMPAILKIYHFSKGEVRQFVKKNKIDFKKREDLIRLLEFCKHFDAVS